MGKKMRNEEEKEVLLVIYEHPFSNNKKRSLFCIFSCSWIIKKFTWERYEKKNGKQGEYKKVMF